MARIRISQVCNRETCPRKLLNWHPESLWNIQPENSCNECAPCGNVYRATAETFRLSAVASHNLENARGRVQQALDFLRYNGFDVTGPED